MELEILKKYYWVRQPTQDGIGKSFIGQEEWLDTLSNGKRKQILSQFKTPNDIQPTNLKAIYV